MAGDGKKLGNPGGDTPAEFDRDVNMRGVAWAGIGLAVLTAAAFVVAWFVFRGMAAHEERGRPEPLPMPEAQERVLPPGPRLQSTPEQDLADMLAQEEALLERYSLVEEGGEYARIPIERAMDLVLELDLGAGAEDGSRAASEAGMIPRDVEVEQPGTPPGGPPAAAGDTTEGHDAQEP